MPLIHSDSREAIADNIREMRRAGHPEKQAIAAAYAIARKAKARKRKPVLPKK